MTQEKQKRPYTRKMKVFVVTDMHANERLVRAYTSADALRHVTPTFLVTPADQDDIISLMAAGTPVETVGPPTILPAIISADESAGLTD
jgi:hypothetical protein